jgi:GNAT superfamily N-acetyltransferase
MGARRVLPLTGELLEELPPTCRSCLFWERGEPAPIDRWDVRSRDDEAALVRKQAWVSAQLQEGRAPGRAIRVEGRLAGWVLFAPGRDLAGPPADRPGMPVPATSPDALQLATLRVEPRMRGHGLGRLLLHAALREAVRLELAAVEVYGDRRWQERSCILPVTWLLHEGFAVHREHLRTPLLRLDTRRTVRWAESLEHAWEEVLGRLPRRVPVPAGEGVPRGVPAPNAAGAGREP